MVQTTMDRKAQATCRAIERSENVRRRINSTPEQEQWEDLYQYLDPVISRRSHVELEYATFALKLKFDAERQAESFSDQNYIIRADRVLGVFLVPIPAECWPHSRATRRIHLDWMESRIFSAEDDLCVSVVDDPKDMTGQAPLRACNALRDPIQDHFKFEFNTYRGDVLFPTKGDLSAPFAGKFTIERNELHCSIMVNGLPVYRVEAIDATSVLTFADDDGLAELGQQVVAGQALVRLEGNVIYGTLKYKKGRGFEPEVHYAGHGVFAASTRRRKGNLYDLRMCIEMMERLVAAQGLAPKDVYDEEHVSFSSWAPRRMLEFTETSLCALPYLDGWAPTLAMKQEMLRGCEPGGDFYIRATRLKQPTTLAEIRDAGDGVQQLLLNNGTSILLPSTAVILPHLVRGSLVEPGDPVADFLPRSHYSWEEFTSQVNILLAHKEFLMHVAVPPGVGGYDGHEVLLDERYVCDAAKALAVTGVGRLDIREMLPYAHGKKKFIVGPAVTMSDWDDLYWEANGVLYNAQPRGTDLSLKNQYNKR